MTTGTRFSRKLKDTHVFYIVRLPWSRFRERVGDKVPPPGRARPEDLAFLGWKWLELNKPSLEANPIKTPQSEDELRELISVAFAASLEQEEGRPIRFRVMYGEVLGYPFAFTRQLDWNRTNLVKLSVTTELGYRVVEVQSHDDQLKITGFVDRALGTRKNFLDWAPHVIDYHYSFNFSLIAHAPGRIRLVLPFLPRALELNKDTIRFVQPLHEIHEVSSFYTDAATASIQFTEFAERDVTALIAFCWGRILGDVSAAHHGGCFIVLPFHGEPIVDQVDIKYELEKPYHLCQSVYVYLSEQVMLWNSPSKIRFGGTKLSEAVIPHSFSDLQRTCDFVASLAAIDGAVVLHRNLYIVGFGTEIKSESRSNVPVLEFGTSLDEGQPIRSSLENLGMRHRSAASFCWAVPGALAFVVSQDGGVSVFSRLDNEIHRHRVFTTALTPDYE